MTIRISRHAKPVRTRVALPTDLLEAIDREVAEERSESRNDFLVEAVEQELHRRREEAIDAAYIAVLTDPEYIQESNQIMKEFEGADSESARSLDTEFGQFPLDANGSPR